MSQITQIDRLKDEIQYIAMNYLAKIKTKVLPSGQIIKATKIDRQASKFWSTEVAKLQFRIETLNGVTNE